MLYQIARPLIVGFLACLLVSSANAVDFSSPGQYDGASDSSSSKTTGSALPATAIDAVWQIIDADKDNRGTDKELDKAVRGLRRLANHPDASEVRDAIRVRFDADKSGLVDKDEAELCLCEVRGLRCPTAKEARAFWASLDSDSNATVTPAEFRARLQPLGQVGRALDMLLGNTLNKIDRDDNSAIDETEVYYSANTVMRIKMATEGNNLARRDPNVWVRYMVLAAQLDMDADNVLSPRESLAVQPLAAHFANIDKDRDRQLTVSELCDFDQHIKQQIAAARARARSIRGSC